MKIYVWPDLTQISVCSFIFILRFLFEFVYRLFFNISGATLFQYGQEAGDELLSTADDACRVSFDVDIVMLGYWRDDLHVSGDVIYSNKVDLIINIWSICNILVTWPLFLPNKNIPHFLVKLCSLCYLIYWNKEYNVILWPTNVKL